VQREVAWILSTRQ